MDVIQAARELGKAIQADERYKEYITARDANDKDEDLQKLIGEFNIIRQNLHNEMTKTAEDKDEAKIAELNAKMQETYNAVMTNVNMANFTIIKGAMDKLLGEVNGIIGLCCDGEDPDTCEYHECGGSCSSCGGCH